MTDTPVRQRRRAVQLDRNEGTITVKRTAYDSRGATESREDIETVRVPTFATEPARLRVHGSITRNTGDFNSVRVEVSLEMPCLPEVTEVNRVYEMCSRWVDGKLEEELGGAVGQRGPGGPELQRAEGGAGGDGDANQAEAAGIRRRVNVG